MEKIIHCSECIYGIDPYNDVLRCIKHRPALICVHRRDFCSKAEPKKTDANKQVE